MKHHTKEYGAISKHVPDKLGTANKIGSKTQLKGQIICQTLQAGTVHFSKGACKCRKIIPRQI